MGLGEVGEGDGAGAVDGQGRAAGGADRRRRDAGADSVGEDAVGVGGGEEVAPLVLAEQPGVQGDVAGRGDLGAHARCQGHLGEGHGLGRRRRRRGRR